MVDTYSNIVTHYINPEDKEGLNEALKLRYYVYCEEKQFIDKHEITNNMQIETDEYDEKESWHFVVENNLATGMEHVIGTVRLVHFSEDKGFPTGKFHPPLNDKIRNYGVNDLNTVAEISRLCINPCFRKRRDDGMFGVGSYGDDKDIRRKYPIVLISLLREMYHFSKKMQIKYWLSSMEDTLYRYLKCIALEFEPLDEDYIEYYGKVKSYLLGIEAAEKSMSQKQEDLYRFFCSTT